MWAVPIHHPKNLALIQKLSLQTICHQYELCHQGKQETLFKIELHIIKTSNLLHTFAVSFVHKVPDCRLLGSYKSSCILPLCVIDPPWGVSPRYDFSSHPPSRKQSEIVASHFTVQLLGTFGKHQFCVRYLLLTFIELWVATSDADGGGNASGLVWVTVVVSTMMYVSPE